VVSTHDQDGIKRRQRAQQVALFRYQLICPALDPSLSTKARGKIVRAIAAQPHAGPFGGQHRYSRDSLDRWIRRYRAGGFDALTPSIRQPGTRIDTEVLELAVALKRENPARTAAQVARIQIFDSKVTTQAQLAELDARGIRFITPRARSPKLTAALHALPAGAWKPLTVARAGGKTRRVRVHEDPAATPSRYPGTIRQLAVAGLGHDEPTSSSATTATRPPNRSSSTTPAG
jgi:hypothetical protein